MICVIALVVFAILGVFSVSHRRLAKEAFDCVFRRITFRPCRTDLNKRIKSRITGKLMKRSPRLARGVYKNFELISWIFLILLIVSLFFSARSVYFLVKYNNCSGPDGGVCILTDLTDEKTCSEQCGFECECEGAGCEGPIFEACNGDCSCIKEKCEHEPS